MTMSEMGWINWRFRSTSCIPFETEYFVLCVNHLDIGFWVNPILTGALLKAVINPVERNRCKQITTSYFVCAIFFIIFTKFLFFWSFLSQIITSFKFGFVLTISWFPFRTRKWIFAAGYFWMSASIKGVARITSPIKAVWIINILFEFLILCLRFYIVFNRLNRYRIISKGIV